MTRNRLIAVALYACVIAAVFGIFMWAYRADFFPSVGFTILISVPFAIGGIIAWTRPKGFNTVWKLLAWQALIVCASLVLMNISGLEGMICIAMAIVPIMLFTFLGGLLSLAIQYWRDDTKDSVQAVIFLPLLLTYFVDLIPPTNQIHRVDSQIYIEASADELFSFVQSIPDIKPDEINTGFTHLLGIPKPTSATWIEADGQAKRISKWGEDVTFIERITDLQPASYINWDFEFPKGWIPEGIEDPHITIGGKYIDVVEGGYKFEPNGTGTILTLWTETHERTKLGFYAKFWNDLFIDDLQSSILELIKHRVESIS